MALKHTIRHGRRHISHFLAQTLEASGAPLQLSVDMKKKTIWEPLGDEEEHEEEEE